MVLSSEIGKKENARHRERSLDKHEIGEPIRSRFRRPYGQFAEPSQEFGVADDRHVARDTLPFYPAYQTSEKHKIHKPHLISRYWEIFKHSLGQCGINFRNKYPWADKDVLELNSYANKARVRAHDFINEHIVEPARLGVEKRILICPPWAAMTVDWIVDIDTFSRSAIALVKEEDSRGKEGAPGDASFRKAINAWITDCTKENNQKRRHMMSPEHVKMIVDHMRTEQDNNKSLKQKLFDKIGGFAAFAAQALYPLGGYAVLGLNPQRVPKHAFDQCEYPFTVVDQSGAVHTVTPDDAAHGNPDLIGNITVETKGVPHSLELLANTVGCDPQTIRGLSNFADTSSVLNGGLPPLIPSTEQIDSLAKESRNCFAALVSGFQRITKPELSKTFFDLLERLECPVIMDITPPPADVQVAADVSASVFTGVIKNAHKIEVISFNVSDSGHLLHNLEDAIKVDALLASRVDLDELKKLKSLFKSDKYTVQDGENPQYIFELSGFLTRLFDCPVRARGRSIDIAAYPEELTKEQCVFIQDMNSGTRQLAAMKAFNKKGYPHSMEELKHFGVELHPRNLGSLYVVAHNLRDQISIQDSILQNMSWIMTSDGKKPITIIASIPEEFVADSPSKISVGDYISIAMALILGRKPQQAGWSIEEDNLSESSVFRAA